MITTSITCPFGTRRASAPEREPRHSTHALLSELGDAELALHVRERSRRALEVLYNRHAAKALGVAYKILRDRDLAEEVVVDAFWRVWERTDQFQPDRGTFASWFYGIVRHLAIDELRRREVRPAPHDDDELEFELAQENNSAEALTDAVARRLNAAHVHAALQAIPASQREVIQLAYFEGLTRQEIARRLGEPLGTVHTRARLALDKLRVILAQGQLA